MNNKAQEEAVATLSKERTLPDFDRIRHFGVIVGVKSSGELWEFHEQVVNAWKERKAN